MTRLPVPVSILAALATAAIGFGAAHLLDNVDMHRLAAERDRARDCRGSGSTVPPCPVEYKNTRIEWREKVEIKPVPDPKQARKIASLSAELTDSQRTVRRLELRLKATPAQGRPAYYYPQNGSMAYPYDTSRRCEAGAAIVFVAATPRRSMAGRRTGDPNVCYVRIASRR